MISQIKSLMSHDGVGETSYVRAVTTLLEGIQIHTLDYNNEDHEHFLGDMLKLKEKLQPEMPLPELLTLVGQVVKTFEEYNRKTGGRLRAQLAGIQSIISALGGAVGSVVSASDTSLSRLRELQTQLAATDKIDDLRLLKTNLLDCLTAMANEVEEHKSRSTASMTILSKRASDFESSIESGGRIPAFDPVTGLPLRGEAETALSRVANAGAAVAAVFALKRFKQVNLRFGHEAGDGLLGKLATHLRSGLRPEEGMYRWSGPALLAIFNRKIHQALLRRLITVEVASLPTYEVSSSSRSAIIPISLEWTLFPVTGPVDELLVQLQTFADSQNS